MQTMPNPDYDVLIAGGGPAGAATAIGLAQAGHTVLVIERRRQPGKAWGETLSPMASQTLRRFLPELSRAALPEWAAPARGHLSVWGAPQAGLQDAFFGPYGLGLCVNRAGLDRALQDAARAQGADVHTGKVVNQLCRVGNQWQVTLNDQSEVTAAYVVDATGRAGALGRYLGYLREETDPLFAHSLGFVTQNPTDRDGYTRVEACSYGWWYSSCLPGAPGARSTRAVVLHADRGSSAARQGVTSEGLIALLGETTLMRETLVAHRYGPTGKVAGAPAGQGRASLRTAAGFLTVGDAAQAYDPLSSQGIERALITGGMAAHTLQYALLNPDIAPGLMHRYDMELTRHWADYQGQHARIYAQERRWAGYPFWTRRHVSEPKLQPEIATDAT